MKFGVVRFPGSCDEVDALHGVPRASARPSCSGTATATCSGVDAVIVPGRLLLRRLPARRRDRPLLAADGSVVERFARDGGPVLGICNGFQVLCEAGLLPGALLPNTSLRFVCRQVELAVENARHAVDARVRRGRSALDPRQAHDRPLLRARPGARRARRPTARSCSATRPATTQRLGARHRRRVQRGRQRGRPDAAPRARGRPAHRAPPTALQAVRVASPRARVRRRDCRRPHRELGLTDAEYDAHRASSLGREPNEVELAVFSLMWSEHCGYKHSQQAAAACCRPRARMSLMGPGENAGAVDVGDGLAVRVQGRVAQPPERGRAVPGRGHGRRRHPARHLRGRRAADRDARLAALRRARLRPLALPARARGGGHRPLRQLDRRRRPSAARSTSSPRTSRTASSTRCASG